MPNAEAYAERESNVTVEARELDRRQSDGIDVQLLWNPDEDQVYVQVQDIKNGDDFTLKVEGQDALDAFHHPYAYAGSVAVANA